MLKEVLEGPSPTHLMVQVQRTEERLATGANGPQKGHQSLKGHRRIALREVTLGGLRKKIFFLRENFVRLKK